MITQSIVLPTNTWVEIANGQTSVLFDIRKASYVWIHFNESDTPPELDTEDKHRVEPSRFDFDFASFNLDAGQRVWVLASENRDNELRITR